jgi:hypothetical protein
VLISSSLGVSVAHAACADTLEIDAGAGMTRSLRQALLRGSLKDLPEELCVGFSIELRPERDGLLLKLASKSGALRTRSVRSVEHAATWVEAWIQSGYGPAIEESGLDSTQRAVTPAARIQEPASATRSEKPEPERGSPVLVPRAFVEVGPLLGVSRQGFVEGAQFRLGHGASRAPFVAANLGIWQQPSPSDVERRRAYFALAEIGWTRPFADALAFEPSIAGGILGSSAQGEYNTNAIGAALGLQGALLWRLGSWVTLTFGLSARYHLTNLFASGGHSASDSEDESENEESEASDATNPELGPMIVALQLGIRGYLGGSP